MLGATYTIAKVVINDKIQVIAIIGTTFLNENGVALSAIYTSPYVFRANYFI
jgi:hypothetical protein